VRNRDGVVTELLFTIHDITRLVATERENRETRMLLNVAVQKASFRNFLADTEGSLRTAIEAIEVQREEIARRNLHTIKGNSGFYGLDSLVSTIHAVEDRAGITLADIDQVEDQLRSFVDRIEQVTGPLLSSNDADLAVSRAGVSRLEEALARGDHAAVAAAARALVAETDTATAKDLLGPFASACEVLARRFDKRVRLELVNPGVRYSRRTWGGVFQNLVHLLRNAIDHGIEPADERGDKPAEAVIRVEFQPEGIVLSDDGRGIDAAAVVARAIELGAVDPAAAAALPRSQQLALIFVDTLSTARAVTETSGRGVGMGAVKAALERAGGALTVDSVPGGGTTFRLTCAHAARRTQPIGLIAAA
jgi:two-component system chemotaxis sensor kinase CheA